MSTEFEKVNGFNEIPDFTDEAIVDIDLKNKEISVIKGQILIEGEKNSQYICFKSARYYDGIDLSEKNIKILYNGPTNYHSSDIAVNVKRNDESIIFGWVVPREATLSVGDLLFTVEFQNREDEDYSLKLQPATIKVLAGMDEMESDEPAEETWYVDLKNKCESALTEAEVHNQELRSLKETLSKILEFKIIATEEELAEIFSFDEDGNANWNCRTMYMVLNGFLGAEYYPSDHFVEFMMLGTDPELDIFEQMEIFGSLAMMPFDDFVTQEQLKDELNSRAVRSDHSAYGPIQLKDNTEFHWGKKSELTITLPPSSGAFHSIVYFDSPSPATILTAPARIEFVGDDCADGVLIPAENTSYEIDIKLVSVSKILAKVTAF